MELGPLDFDVSLPVLNWLEVNVLQGYVGLRLPDLPSTWNILLCGKAEQAQQLRSRFLDAFPPHPLNPEPLSSQIVTGFHRARIASVAQPPDPPRSGGR